VKITGVSNQGSSAESVEPQQLSGLPARDPVAEGEKVGEIEGMASCGVQDGLSIEVASLKDKKDEEQVEEVVHPPLVAGAAPIFSESISHDSSNDDADLLDLLVDTLDGEFDPNLLI